MDKSQASFLLLQALVTGADVRNMSSNDIEKYAETAIALAEALHKKLKEE